MHMTMFEFLERLRYGRRQETLHSYQKGLSLFWSHLEAHGIDPLRITLSELQEYQRWLVQGYRKRDGEALALETQIARLTPILSYYKYVFRRGLTLTNPASLLKLPRAPKRVTLCDYLDLQEAIALIQTQARRVSKHPSGGFNWAVEYRNFGFICIALATGRRRHFLLNMPSDALDLQRCELRVEREKGRSGRVLPVAPWAISVLASYLQEARPKLLTARKDEGFLFPGVRGKRMCATVLCDFIAEVQCEAAAENPDLLGLQTKNITPHSFRVSFATLLFKGGCNIRSVNELMLHSSLSTTARYTPIPLEDLRRACRLYHPRN